MLKDADRLTSLEKVSATPKSSLELLAERLSCEPTMDAVVAELGRVIKAADLFEEAAEILGVGVDHPDAFVQAVSELNREAEETRPFTEFGRMVVDVLGLSMVSVRLLSGASFPADILRRELLANESVSSSHSNPPDLLELLVQHLALRSSK